MLSDIKNSVHTQWIMHVFVVHVNAFVLLKGEHRLMWFLGEYGAEEDTKESQMKTLKVR